MGHNHSHSHSTLSGKNLLISIVLNVIITAAQLIGGFISGSFSTKSDGACSLIFQFIFSQFL